MTNIRAKSTPRDVFLYLLSTGMLYAIAVASISLLFQYVNHFFPDATEYYPSVSEILRVVLSVLIIVTPVHVFVTRFLNKDLLGNPEKHSMGIRRWLVHLTLFVSGITIIVDLVTLVYNFLGGELSMRFFLKIVAVLLVAAVVFVYYIWDIRREGNKAPKRMQQLAIAALSVLAVAVVGAFFIMDTPSDLRARRLDDRRVSDLWAVENAVQAYYQTKGELPVDLAAAFLDYGTQPTDPVDESAYEYRVLTTTEFEVCATFAEPVDLTRGYSPASYDVQGLIVRDYYTHRAGRDCFNRTVRVLTPKF